MVLSQGTLAPHRDSYPKLYPGSKVLNLSSR